VTPFHTWGKNVMAKIKNGRHCDKKFLITSLLYHTKGLFLWQTVRLDGTGNKV